MTISTQEFLEAVLPAKGWFFSAEQRASGGFPNVAHRDIASLAAEVEAIAGRGNDAYMAMAQFGEPSYVDSRGRTKKRTKDNAVRARSVWVDIDCGDGKPYATRNEGAEALKQFLADTGMPNPTHMINSGGGWHLYWAFDKDLPKESWQKIATLLKRLCTAAGFRIDEKCTDDIARVLRPVGTINTKYDSGAPVTAIYAAPAPIGVDLFARKLGSACRKLEVDTSTPSHHTDTERPDWLRDGDYSSDIPAGAFGEGTGYTDPDAEKMADGCQMLGRMRASKGADQTYMEWFYSLTLLQKSQQGEAICHEWSSGYDGYNPSDLEAKLDEVRDGKPVLCQTVREDLPNVCAGCTQTCNSAVSLGFPEIKTPSQIVDEETGEVETITMAEVHKKEFRWTEERGLECYRPSDDDEGGGQWTPICNQLPLLSFLYRDERLELWVRMHVRLRANSYLNADLPFGVLGGGGNKLGEAMAKHAGIIMEGQRQKALMVKYMRTWIDHTMKTTNFQQLARWMGWQKNWSFLHGDVLYHKDGTKTLPAVSGALAKPVELTTARGSLDRYVEIVDELYNRPNRVHFQIAWMASLASPLLQIQHPHPVGLVMSFTSPISGVGKTSAAQMGMSVWGESTGGDGGTIAAKRTTDHAMYVIAGQRRNLPMLIDETSDWSTEALASFLYSYSMGQPKAQGAADGGLRDNSHLQWFNVCYLTTNNSSTDDLIAASGNAEPKIMRLFEVPFPDITKDLPEKRRLHSQLITEAVSKHSGQAGAAFIEAIIPYVDHLPDAIEAKVKWLQDKTGVSNAGRYWLRLGACLLVAFAASKKAGLHSFDAKPFTQKVIKIIETMKRRAENAVPSAEDVIARYLAENHNGLIVTKQLGSDKQKVPFASGHQAPRGEIVGRVVSEGKDAGLYLAGDALRRWCGQHSMPFQQVVQELKENGLLIDRSKRFYLGKGTTIPVAQCRCVQIDYRIVSGALSLVSDSESEDDVESS